MFSNCIRCGRELKDPWSARKGIGPVCERKQKYERMLDRVGGSVIQANYIVVDQNDERVLIKDIGPWDQYMTVTNAAEWVVSQMNSLLHGRRLFYIDSEGVTDELLVEDGKFAGFKAIESHSEVEWPPDSDLSEEETEDILDEMNRDYNRGIANSLKRGY